ncbi:MAG: branched-chain amino acid ABC transporter permease [Oscillospiraceae bacterium]|nr:branched-chain amino acid ABC transporter permease [Oscillospiraceae bacterium]
MNGVTITPQNIITAAAVIAAVIAILGYYNKAYKWYQKQEKQDKDIKAIKREQTLTVYALRACLDGLSQLGANHVVPEAKDKLDKYINQQAHDQLD